MLDAGCHEIVVDGLAAWSTLYCGSAWLRVGRVVAVGDGWVKVRRCSPDGAFLKGSATIEKHPSAVAMLGGPDLPC